MFRIAAKNGTTFDTDNDALAEALKKQGHTVSLVDDDADASPKPKRRSSPKPKKSAESDEAETPALAEQDDESTADESAD